MAFVSQSGLKWRTLLALMLILTVGLAGLIIPFHWISSGSVSGALQSGAPARSPAEDDLSLRKTTWHFIRGLFIAVCDRLDRSLLYDWILRTYYNEELSESMAAYHRVLAEGLASHANSNSNSDSNFSNARCACKRQDAKSFSQADLYALKEPLILTNVLDWSLLNRSVLTREALLKDYGFEVLEDNVNWLHKNGAGVFVHFMMRLHNPLLAEVVQMNQPGNVFLSSAPHAWLDDDGMAHYLQHPIVQALLDQFRDVFAQRDILQAPSKVFPAVSFGSKGQWNQVHNHMCALSIQVHGSKGWVLAPPFAFPDAAKRQFNDPDPYHFFLRDIGHEHVCGPFLETPKRVPFRSDSHQVGASAVDNLTKWGRCCEVHEGEALLTAGWWHGTCDLDDWSAGFTLFVGP